MGRTYGRVRNHIVTGFLFIMPVLICVAVLSRFWKHLYGLAGSSREGSGLIPLWGHPAMPSLPASSSCCCAAPQVSWCVSRS